MTEKIHIPRHNTTKQGKENPKCFQREIRKALTSLRVILDLKKKKKLLTSIINTSSIIKACKHQK